MSFQDSRLVHDLAGYLCNALWQVPLLFAAATLASTVLRRQSVTAVHRVWVTTLALQACLPALALACPPGRLAISSLFGAHGASSSSLVTVSFGDATVRGGVHLWPWFGEAVVLAFGLALLRGVVRLGLGLYRTAQLLRSATPVADPRVIAVWERCRTCFALPEAELLESAMVRTPLTFGMARHHVMVPLGLLTTLGEDELRTLFSHECVHIRRRDFGWNLLYEVLALPLSWHPLAPFTRNRLVESREWVCDALAADASPQPRVYARCLLRLATLLQQDVPAEPVHAIGMLDANALERRLMQLTISSSFRSLPRRIAAVAVVSVVGLGTCACAWAFSTDGKGAPASQTTQQNVQKVPADVMAGQTINRVNPEYPKEARDAHMEGSVVLKAEISAEGRIEKLTVASGEPTLSAAAIDAVKQWTYKPYLLNGMPVAVETTITVNFQLAE